MWLDGGFWLIWNGCLLNHVVGIKSKEQTREVSPCSNNSRDRCKVPPPTILNSIATNISVSMKSAPEHATDTASCCPSF